MQCAWSARPDFCEPGLKPSAIASLRPNTYPKLLKARSDLQLRNLVFLDKHTQLVSLGHGSLGSTEIVQMKRHRIAAEFFGTFFLVFAGTGAMVINDQGGQITHLGVALVFGLVVLTLIYAFGEISGAHFNPAVTLAFAASKRFRKEEVLGYLLAQFAGGFAASGFLRVLFPSHASLGATIPSGSSMQSFLLEVVLTWFLMVVILRVSIGAREKRITAGLVVGAVIGLEALFAGPICGASMNPIRSIAPAVVSGQMSNLWIYLVAPILGAFLAIPTDQLLGPVPSNPSP